MSSEELEKQKKVCRHELHRMSMGGILPTHCELHDGACPLPEEPLPHVYTWGHPPTWIPNVEIKTEKQFDPVERPSHYNQGEIECIEAMEAMLTREEFIGYLRGTVFKYNWRCRSKQSTLQDLEKGQWYLNRLIQLCRKYNIDVPTQSLDKDQEHG
jgi:hypothetical protein